MVGGEQHGDIESWTGGARYDNTKETSWGQGDMVMELRKRPRKSVKYQEDILLSTSKQEGKEV